MNGAAFATMSEANGIDYRILLQCILPWSLKNQNHQCFMYYNGLELYRLQEYLN